jgi:putative membrane protein
MPTKQIAWLREVFRFPVLVRLWPYLLVLGLYTTAVEAVTAYARAADGSLAPSRPGELLLGSLLFGWFMAFRARCSYERWYEARSLWGTLVNDSRNLSLKAGRLVPDDPEGVARLRELLGRFAAELRAYLARPASDPGPHHPLATAGEVYDVLLEWKRAARIDGFAFLSLDQHAKKLTDVSGGCEKIRGTPLAASYVSLMRKGLTLYLLGLPWLAADDLGWWTVLLVVPIGYVLIGLELIATDIENPFDGGADDLPLDGVVATIRRTT